MPRETDLADHNLTTGRAVPISEGRGLRAHTRDSHNHREESVALPPARTARGACPRRLDREVLFDHSREAQVRSATIVASRAISLRNAAEPRRSTMREIPHPADHRPRARSHRQEAFEAADAGMDCTTVDADQTAGDGETPSDEEWG